MKIAMIAPTEIPARRANTVQVMKMAQALCASGHDVRLVAPVSSTSNSASQADMDEWGHLAHHYGLKERFPFLRLSANPRLRRYDYSLSAVRWARSWNAEILFTRLPQAAALASTFGLPTIFEAHDLPQGRLGPAIFRSFLRGRGARRLVIITQALAQDLAQKFGMHLKHPFTVIAPDGVDLDRYKQPYTTSQARQALAQQTQVDQTHLLNGPPIHLPDEGFIAGYTGHLYPGRCSELLLSIAEELPGLQFLIVGGEAGDIKQLTDRINKAKLENIILTGFVPNADLPVYQAACDVLLMPYQRQVAASSGGDIGRYLSPMKLFEYLACQRAILSSDLPVLREILTPQNAILLPPDNPQAWVAALRELRDNPDRGEQLASQAVLDAQRYTWEERAAKVLANLPETNLANAE